MPARTCPVDQQPMQALYVKAAGREVEIDRCTRCGSIWFDAGELEQIVAVRAEGSVVESGTMCPGCSQPLAYARLKGELDAEVCHRCHGSFVGAPVIRALAPAGLPGRGGGLVPPLEVRFMCTQCGRRAWLATSSDAVCAECSPPSASGSTGVDPLQVASGVVDVLNLLSIFF